MIRQNSLSPSPFSRFRRPWIIMTRFFRALHLLLWQIDVRCTAQVKKIGKLGRSAKQYCTTHMIRILNRAVGRSENLRGQVCSNQRPIEGFFSIPAKIWGRGTIDLPSVPLVSTALLKIDKYQGDCRKEPRRDPLCTKTKINQNS